MRKLFLATAVLLVGVTLLYAPPKKQSGKSFYLTVTDHDGADAPFACVPGFHMASIYEILDPTGLTYDSGLGVTPADAGNGPPAGAVYQGWMRGGHDAAGSGGVFQANCQAYQSNNPQEVGVAAHLGITGINAPEPWIAQPVACDQAC